MLGDSQSPFSTIEWYSHEAREFVPADKAKNAQRDVIVNFVRKPLVLSDGSDRMRDAGTDHVVAIKLRPAIIMYVDGTANRRK